MNIIIVKKNRVVKESANFIMKDADTLTFKEGQHKFVLLNGNASIGGVPLVLARANKITGAFVVEAVGGANIHVIRTSVTVEHGDAELKVVPDLPGADDPMVESYKLFQMWAVRNGLVQKEAADADISKLEQELMEIEDVEPVGIAARNAVNQDVVPDTGAPDAVDSVPEEPPPESTADTEPAQDGEATK
jgi:hypothetical protein